MATQVSIGKDSIVKDNDDLLIIDLLKGDEIENLKSACGSQKSFDQLIRYADAKIKAREDDTPISNPYNYLLAIGINDGFIEEH